MNEKNDKKIIEYLKEHPAIASLLFSIICLIVQLLINYIVYRMNCSYLSYWNISSDYLPKTQSGYIYIIIQSFIQLIIFHYINSCCYKGLSEYCFYEKKAKNTKLRLKYLLKDIKDLKRLNKNNRNKIKKLAKKEHIDDLTLIDKMNKLLDETDADIVKKYKTLKELRKELSNQFKSIIIACVLYILLSGVLSFVFVFGLLYYSQNKIEQLLIVSGFMAVIMAAGNLIIFFRLKSSNVNETKINEIDEDEVQDNNNDEIIDKFTLNNIFNDVTIKGSIVLAGLFLSVAFFVFPVCIKTEVRNKKDYYTTTYNGETCVVIFSGSDDIIIKKCRIDNDIVYIDLDGFTIISKKNQEFDYMKFSKVMIEDLDK